MALTYTYSGSLQIIANGTNTYSGDYSGSEQAQFAPSTITFAAAGGAAPTISGFVKGTTNASTVATSLLLAHATNILTNFSATATYSDGFTVAGTKVKLLALQNNDTANNITISTPSSNNFALIQATNQSFATIQPSGVFLCLWPTGIPSGGLTTGTNDALALVTNAGTAAFAVLVIYGP